MAHRKLRIRSGSTNPMVAHPDPAVVHGSERDGIGPSLSPDAWIRADSGGTQTAIMTTCHGGDLAVAAFESYGGMGERGRRRSIAAGCYSLVWMERRGRSCSGNLVMATPESSDHAGKARPATSERSGSIFGWDKDGRKESRSFQQRREREKKEFGVFIFISSLLFMLFS